MSPVASLETCFQFCLRTPGQASWAVYSRCPWAWGWGQASRHRAGVSEVGPDGQDRWVYVLRSGQLPSPPPCLPSWGTDLTCCCPPPTWGNPLTEGWVPEDAAEAIVQVDPGSGPFQSCRGTSWVGCPSHQWTVCLPNPPPPASRRRALGTRVQT